MQQMIIILNKSISFEVNPKTLRNSISITKRLLFFVISQLFIFAANAEDSASIATKSVETPDCIQLLRESTNRYSFLDSMLFVPKPTVSQVPGVQYTVAPKNPFTRVHSRNNAETGGEITVAVFPKGTYSPTLESQLKQAGYFAIVQLGADDIEASRYKDFMYGPAQNFWQQSAYLGAEEVDPKTLENKDVRRWFESEDKELRSWILSAAPQSKDRSSIRGRLAKMESGYTADIAPLTMGDYEKWNREIFAPGVAKKKGGINVWPASAAEMVERNHLTIQKPDGTSIEVSEIPYEERVIANYYRLFFKDKDGNLAAGAIFFHEVIPGKTSRIVIRAAVYNEASRIDGAATATIAHALRLTRALGRPLLENKTVNEVEISYGSDPNFYGPDVEVSLQAFKFSMGFIPFPKPGPDGSIPKLLIKVLNRSLSQIDDRTAEQKNDPKVKPPSFVFFELEPDGWLKPRILLPE